MPILFKCSKVKCTVCMTFQHIVQRREEPDLVLDDFVNVSA